MIVQLMEALIPLVSQFKESMELIKDSYLRLPPLIEREHRAIKSGIFCELQSICDEKEDITQGIEQKFHTLSKTIKDMSEMLASPMNSVSGALEALNMALTNSEFQDSLAFQVLMHVTKSSIKASEDLSQTITRVKPIIEANKELVTHLMESYAQSYRFWQEIQEQVSSSYSPEGIQKVTGRISGFRARA